VKPLNLSLRPVHRNHQHGVAAVEFALVLTVLVLGLYGIATFAAVFHTQQTLARAAENGARAAIAQTGMAQASGAALSTAESRVRSVVHEGLASSLIVPLAHSGSAANRLAWVVQNVTVSVSTPNPAVTVTVSYPYAQSGLFPSVPLLDAARWVPETLISRATAALPTV
jgi:Flp pilus assembly protein TadG